jgi:hypothetical protein
MRPLLITLLVFCASAADAATEEACSVRSGAELQPLVELYTSEGCSSCPPADRWLSRRIGEEPANFLAFHVDYWDDIGWPDRFASPVYSQRQRSRVRAAEETTVYTPQVMVGNAVRAEWRNEAVWRRTLQQQRQTPPRAALALRLQRDGDAWQAALGAATLGAPAKGAQVWLARYVDAQTTQVHAGENRGASLRHDRVVRQLSGPWPLGDEPLSLRIPLAAESAPWGITAFVQDANGSVLQSLALSASCREQSR